MGVKPLFPDSKIDSFPYGECFTATISNREIPFFHSGWGKIASAGTLQYLIDRYAPDLIVNLGTCGGFEGVVNQGDVILVGQTIVYDIVELMGDLDIANYYASSLDLSWLADPLPHPARRALVASADSDLPPEMIPALTSSIFWMTSSQVDSSTPSSSGGAIDPRSAAWVGAGRSAGRSVRRRVGRARKRTLLRFRRAA